ncbi:MAG TPA: zincin-like metallopeptidase domain-containing protein [Phycisphaerae bacterium]|jgi:antirestriction protein ArdC|nr:zincin-like metallopeptidase domain-containing protein [Phycisphaerae bacterium]HWB99727.1 zincin-like metallopeptidase domain-containing protein [Bryobacteraceae bacterium]
MKFDLYSEVTNHIIAMLDKGVIPWRSPILGAGTAGHPKNLESDRPYRGVNVFLLAFTAYAKGYGSSYWLTFNQARARGGCVKKGEKSSMVVFWKQLDVTDEDSGEPRTVPMLRYYNVFNAEQCDGIRIPDLPAFTPSHFTPIEAAENIIKGFAGAPAIEHGGTQAFYRPLSDSIRLPEPTRFATPEEYYATLMHECVHSTGHSKRLDRKLDTDPKPFGSPDYGREELIAEMGAAFLCGQAGIQPAVIDNQAAYIGGWLRQLKNDRKLVIAAASAAQKAADWICGRKETQEQP